ncbi:MAG: sigma-70 family RNA polymerase sigma factor [Clostridia bacterium]|nr:sigma-70 family RNA polymerase sigma factor [Clostridia bacterium]
MKSEKKKNSVEVDETVMNYYGYVRSLALFLSGGDTDAADEIAQETFLFLVEKWDELTRENIGGWLSAVTRNKTHEYLRERARRGKRTAVSSDMEDLYIPVTDEYFRVTDEEIEEARRHIIDSLSDEEKELFASYFGKRMTYGELMARFGASYDSVRMKLFRLRRKIRKKAKDKNFLTLILM